MSKLPKGADPTVAEQAQQGVDEGKTPEHFLELAALSKSAFKAVAWVLEQPKSRDLLMQLSALAETPHDEPHTVRRILRRAAQRETRARQRSNPIVRNDPFLCGHCNFDVPPLARGERNHCPRCLYSRHVDGPAPGDRSSQCGGLMVAEHLEMHGGIPRATHRCLSCGFTRRNRLFPDRQPEPDQLDILLPTNTAENSESN